MQLTVPSADSITVTVDDAGTATVEDLNILDAAKLDKDGDGASVTVTFDETADPDVTSFATFLSSIVSGLSLSKLLRVIKTGLSYIAPKNHAADDVTYGGATSTKFGHVVLSDVFSSADPNGAAANSMGASQTALNSAYAVLNDAIGGLLKIETTHLMVSLTLGYQDVSLSLPLDNDYYWYPITAYFATANAVSYGLTSTGTSALIRIYANVTTPNTGISIKWLGIRR
jgi:hypothetical protein